MNRSGRRGFIQGLLAAGAVVSATGEVEAQEEKPAAAAAAPAALPQYAILQNHTSLKQSSYDRTGGNDDSWEIGPGETKEIFNAEGPGIITHIWLHNSSGELMHLKEFVLRAYWDGNEKPSVECPVGDFFGLNLGEYQFFESAYLACAPERALNCYFAMPFRKSARLTLTNEGEGSGDGCYSNIDYKFVPSLPDSALYFHAQYRQCSPCVPVKGEDLNLTGAKNYVFVETRGRGHLMGVTLGVLLNDDGWMGEGDDMIFVDDATKPVINGTGTEDYFLGSWNFGARKAVPFAHHFYGAPSIINPERTGGRYCLYRWHGDNPVTFSRYLKHTIEHGSDNDRGDDFFSCAYWYQDQPYTDFPPLPAVEDRTPRVKCAQRGIAS